jgi:formamidopyrimidine-DNA glycosylase
VVLELPDAEVLRRDLEREVVGKRAKDVAVATPGVLKPWHRTRKDFAALLEGRRITGVRRRGNVMLLELDDDLTWLVDPGAQGSLHLETSTTDPGADTHVAVAFATGGALHISEAGREPTLRCGVVPADEADDASGVSRDALDLLADTPTWVEFGRYLIAGDDELKPLLCDPKRFLGLGPVYSDEILWEAALRHDRRSTTLSPQEIRRFYRAAHEVLVAAMKASGSSLEDSEPDSYTDEDGSAAGHLNVYGREGLACPRCRTPIERTRLKRGMVTFHCPRCMV